MTGPAEPRSGHARGVGTGRLRAPWWWVIPAVLFCGTFVYAAVLAGAFYSFTDWHGIGKFNLVGLSNYQKILQSPDARQALINTIVLALGFVILTNVFGLLFALALNRTIKSRHILRVLIFLPVVLSPLAVSYVWKFIFQEEGPLNLILRSLGLDSLANGWLGNPSTAIWTILVVAVWQSIGLTMVIYLAGLAGIPPEIEEAAAMDGAGALARFRYITAHQLRPTILIATSLMLIQGLRIFDQVIAMTGGGPYGATETLATLVYKSTFVSGKYGLGAALSVLMTVLIVAVSLAQVWIMRRGED